ncbi:hypothetical protein NNA36_04120 [Shimia sp. CNT1-13L.2]|uniref:calcium-binding protein n=1 Tax=Shimia sp. CNT1-13L.2 TaxID=2959663 RepID=UPI0020CDD12E|nr:calcium-binding protein [Shimia sp. CNT1-13L.2]MCP9481141.1 hypothetical protein [Shimia sp. CNT1-13L.2]
MLDSSAGKLPLFPRKSSPLTLSELRAEWLAYPDILREKILPVLVSVMGSYAGDEVGFPDLDQAVASALDEAGVVGAEVASVLGEDGFELRVSGIESAEDGAALELTLTVGESGVRIEVLGGSEPVVLDFPKFTVAGLDGQGGSRSGEAGDSPELSDAGAGEGESMASGAGEVAHSSPPTITAAQLQSLADGIEAALDTLHARVVAEVLAETLPLIGNGLLAAEQGGEAALQMVEALGTALSDALDILAAGGSHGADAVETALNAALAGAGFTGTTLSVTVQGGAVHVAVQTQGAGSYLQGLAGDLGTAGLGAVGGGSGTLSTVFDFDLDFATGGSGFFLDTSAANDISIDLDLTNATFDPSLTLAGQGFDALDAGTGLSGSISLDLQGAGNSLTLGQLGSATLDAELDGTASLQVGLTAQSQGDMTPPIGAELNVDWSFTDATINVSDTNTTFGDRPDVSFETVTMDLGGFMEDFAGPLIEQLDKLLEPLRPILNVLDASIKLLENFPGLSGVFDKTGDGRVTLIDVMKFVFPNLDTGPFETVVELAKDVADWADFLDSTGFSQGDLILGDVDLGTADIRLPGFDLATVTAQFGGLADNLQTVLNGLGGSGWDATDGGSGDTGADILDSMINDGIFGLPILTDPSQWMNLLLGAPADLVSIDLPEISIGPKNYKNLFSVPVFPGVFLDIDGFANATINLDFGFDTRGLLDPALDALDGLYIVDDPNEAEIVLNSGVQVGLELNAFVASIGGGGNVQGVINLDLDDNLGSTAGKLYYDEFIAALTTNPFSMFDASGSITAGFSAWVDTILGEIWRWDSPRVTLGNFGFDSPGIDLDLAKMSGGTMTLHTGGRAGDRNLLVPNFDIAEAITVDQSVETGKVDLSINGYTERYNNVSHIKGNGQLLRDSISVATNLAISVDFSGGDGDDVLSGAMLGDTLKGGADNDGLFGNGGDDSLRGGLGNDLLDGGEGADTLEGGDGIDWVSYVASDAGVDINFGASIQFGGHALGDVLSGFENLDGSAHDDTVEGSQGDGNIFGRSGNDSLVGGSHLQILFGNDGDDTLESNAGGDTLVGGEGDDTYIVRATNIRVNENENGEIAEGSDSGYDWLKAYVSVDLRGMDDFIERITLFNSATTAFANGMDNLINGNAQDNGLYGYGGADTIYANNGNDTVYGHGGGDLVTGGKGDDELRGGGGNDSLFGNFGDDKLYGDDGDDVLTGGFGSDTLYAGSGADDLWGGAENDYYKVDVLDVVHEFNGGGIDFVWADDDHALTAGQEIEVLSIYSWQNLLVAITLAGVTQNYDGLAAAIQAGVQLGAVKEGSLLTADLTGNEYNQILIAEMSNIDQFFENTLEGMAGADTIVGDGRHDVASYLQSDAAVQIDLSFNRQNGGHAQGDFLHGIHHVQGSAFDDTILGESTLAGATVEDANDIHGREGNDLINGFGGNDTLRGGSGDDTVLGGFGDNKLFGGLGKDSLEGESGADTLDGGQDVDTLIGGLGDDRYIVTTGDVIVDADGDDTVEATEDFYLGIGDEIEHLEATSGSDDLLLYGNAFAQVIDGNDGDNTIHGGAGADTIDGGDGTDRASYLLSNGAVQVNLNIAVQSGGHAAGDVLSGIENLRGSIFGDTLIGLTGPNPNGSNDNVHFGEAGHDWIEDVFGQNTLHGEGGNDTLVGSGSLPLLGGNGSLLLGGAGNDSLDGGHSTATGGDTLAGGMGDDTYRVTSAGDVVDENWNGDIAAGADGGHDTLISDVASWDMDTTGQAEIEDAVIEGGVDLKANDLANHVTGNASDNDITGRAGDDTLLGLGGDDTLRGGNGNDHLDGGSGDDQMIGWAGDDLFVVDSSGDSVVETDGNGDDTVQSSITYTLGDFLENLELTGGGDVKGFGNALDNRIEGNSGDNILRSYAGNDTLLGGSGIDTIYGGTGDDDLTGGLGGGDSLFGQGGDDILRIVQSEGSDHLDGGAGTDLGDFSGITTFTALMDLENGFYQWSGIGPQYTLVNIENIEGGAASDTVEGSVDANWIDGNDGDDDLKGNDGFDTLLGGLGNDTLTGGLGSDSLEGGDGADDLTGNSGNDAMIGGRGNDSLRGGNGADTLKGGNGVDTLKGGGGHDTVFGSGGKDQIEGGNGNDTLEGGLGDDVFVFGDGFGQDEVIDFDAVDGEKIDLSGVTNIVDFNDLVGAHLVDVGGTAQIVDGADTILLVGVSFADVGVGKDYSDADFIF